MRNLITCPVTGRLEEIDFAVDPEDGRILEVRRCSAFSPADLVRCDELCVQRLNQRSALRRGRDPDPEDPAA
jgi:hypothetical protein